MSRDTKIVLWVIVAVVLGWFLVNAVMSAAVFFAKIGLVVVLGLVTWIVLKIAWRRD